MAETNSGSTNNETTNSGTNTGESKTPLAILTILFDYILFHECAEKDFLTVEDSRKRFSIAGTCKMMDYLNWGNLKISEHPKDKGGKTICGIIKDTWESYLTKKAKEPVRSLETMTRQDWLNVISYFWNEYSHASECCNYACAFMLLQSAWGGFSSAETALKKLKENAEIKDYKFIKSGHTYKKIADATHAYNDKMKPYAIIRETKINQNYNGQIDFRCGWMRRGVFGFGPDGLYVDDTFTWKKEGLTANSTIADWEAVAAKWRQEKNPCLKKIFDWGATPEQIAAMAAGAYSFSTGAGGGMMSPMSSEAYRGAHGIYQLGDFTSSPDMTITPQQVQTREEVLETLIGASYAPDDIKKCIELITVEKIKNCTELKKPDKTENETSKKDDGKKSSNKKSE